MAYDIGWTSIQDLQDGQVVSDNFDDTFLNIQVFLNELNDKYEAPLYLQFVPQTVDPTLTEGGFYYDGNQHSFIGRNDVAGTKLNLGSEMVERVVSTGLVEIPEAMPVAVSGGIDSSNAIGVVAADAAVLATAVVIGMTTSVIDANGTTVGLVTTSGRVNGVDTKEIPENGIVYLAEGGGITGTPPPITTVIGYVAQPSTLNTADGSIFVLPRSIVSLPNVVAFMNMIAEKPAIATLDANRIAVIEYADPIGFPDESGGVIMPYDTLAGTIVAPATGIFDMTIDFGVNYDDIGASAQHLLIEIMADDGVNPETVAGQYNKEVARNSTSTNGSMTKTFKAYKGMTYYAVMSCPDATFSAFILENFSFSLKSFDIR